MNLKEKISFFAHSVARSFSSRTEAEGKKQGVNFGISLAIELKEHTLWFTFSKDNETHSFTIPMPFEDKGILIIEQNEVRRAVCSFFIRQEDLILDYLAVMARVVLDNPAGLISKYFIKKVPFIQQIVYSFGNKNTATTIYSLQRAINEVLSKLPLHETNLKSWATNHRLIIIDEVFEGLRSPEERLAYHIQKNAEFFPRGWTSIGMSDGSLSEKNYILTTDLRKLTPYGMKHHNPGRNLFQTMGMKGDELPKVRSQSLQNLMDTGITRKGWNWFTLFADIPDVFEDQIMVDESHRDKFILHTKRYQCFGMLKVKEGERVSNGQTLSISDLGLPKKVDVDADRIKVKKIAETVVNVGGIATKAYNVIVEYKRNLRDGVKITNMHGNKGVIRMAKLGHAIDPRDGSLRKIDVIVSAKSIKKRKNFGQLFEALNNNLYPEENKPIVLPDDYEVDAEKAKKHLVEKGFPEDGTWAAETYVGFLTGVCGEVFWGVTASVENALWSEEDTVRVNSRLLRTAGLKFSHVELRAIQTRFGKENPLFAEIMSYAQGSQDMHECINILKSKKGILPEGLPVLGLKDILPVNQAFGTIVDEKYLEGTIVDEQICPDGFILQLPVACSVMRDAKGEIVYEGAATPIFGDKVKEVFNFDKIYVPKGPMRRCWQHDTGKYGLSEYGVLLNNIVALSHRYLAEKENAVNILLMYRSVFTYFRKVAAMMGGKKGEISRLGMSVRYPFSAKAVATLCNRLPKNTVEIHESMAEQMHIKNGDVVIVERFPCLGFMSLRPQKVRVSHDEMCRYTIRVSGNNLCSLGLDFDGDVIYLASFHTPEAKTLLRNEFNAPNKECYKVICQLNAKAGVPHIDCLTLDDYNVVSFKPVTKEQHVDMVDKATGVKSHTGPVIALAYNLMRILENSRVADDQNVNIAVEVFLDRVGNTVFKQKHGVKSLHSIVVDSICMGDVETLVKHEFVRETAQIICDIITEKAREIGVYDLEAYHKKAKAKGWSNIINRIVRIQNKIYFASRSSLEGCMLLDHIDAPAVDVPSRIFRYLLDNKARAVRTILEEMVDAAELEKLKDSLHKDAAQALFEILDSICDAPSVEDNMRAMENFQKNVGYVMASLGAPHAERDATAIHKTVKLDMTLFS
jgi:hypothetical protein